MNEELLLILLSECSNVGGISNPLYLDIVFKDNQGRSLLDSVLFRGFRILVHDNKFVFDTGICQELLGHETLGTGRGGEEHELSFLGLVISTEIDGADTVGTTTGLFIITL